MSYLLRMVCVCAATFFLLHLAAALLVRALTPLALQMVKLTTAANGARMLFVLRLLPIAAALSVVLALCVPSYLRFERDAPESVGLACLLLAASCAAMLLASALRGTRALISTWRLTREPGGAIFALVGFVRPQMLISAEVRASLSKAQMEAAILHEEAHRRARDNWKRLAMVLTPALGFSKLEAAWARHAEWAADDAAMEGEPSRALALAEAMVHVAKLSNGHRTHLPVSSLVAGKDELSKRIERLLKRNEVNVRRRKPMLAKVIAMAGTGATLLFLLHEASLLYAVHDAMEHLVR
jgi:hypothetical protein